MQEFWKNIGVALVPGIIIAVTTARLTVQLALKQFSKQKLWEKKLRAYEEILVALHNMKRYSEAYIEACERGRDFDEVGSRVIGPRRDAQAVLNRTIDTGEL